MFLLPALVALLAGCSPAENWRQIGFEGTALKAQLPCKPDRTSREVPLGGVPVQLSVAGCESEGAMLAVMTAALAPGTDAQAVLLGWQKATALHWQAAEPQTQAWAQAGMLPLSAARELRTQAITPDGRTVDTRAVWGAFAEGDHVRLVHAVVHAPKVSDALAKTLFDGVQP